MRLELVPRRVDLVDQAELARFLGGHEMIAVERALDRLEILAGVGDVDLVQATLQLDDVLSMALDVRGLAGKAARRLGANPV